MSANQLKRALNEVLSTREFSPGTNQQVHGHPREMPGGAERGDRQRLARSTPGVCVLGGGCSGCLQL